MASPAAPKVLTPEEREEQRKELERMVRELESVCFEVMESGAVRSLVLLTAGPEPEPGGGKKKKKAKEPPQPPGMPEAHLHATLALRHCSLFPFTHKEMLDFGAVAKLTKLVESKVAQTRLNAQVSPLRGAPAARLGLIPVRGFGPLVSQWGVCPWQGGYGEMSLTGDH